MFGLGDEDRERLGLQARHVPSVEGGAALREAFPRVKTP
jgi:hypothetical protein